MVTGDGHTFFFSSPSILKTNLSDLATWTHVLGGSDHAEAFIEVDSRENHALALDAHHVARGEVCYE